MDHREKLYADSPNPKVIQKIWKNRRRPTREAAVGRQNGGGNHQLLAPAQPPAQPRCADLV
ncbi:unnamed protein product [Linum tenue]|uniref:Uncharacterized protein n=1 Tax=Linum tenue TaxID=586396 RepID=A0AAV0PPG3_9ROSI|nr:unnamed protein product [Linum tenue]